MLQEDGREMISAAMKGPKKPEQPILKTESVKIENYSNLVYQIVSELGFLIPDIKFEDDPLKRKYQPSLKYSDCLKDLLQVLNKIYNESSEIFDLIRCRVGEWQFMQNHFLPLLIQLINTSPIGNNDIYILLEIINVLIFCIDEDDAVKPAYYHDLIHHNCINKKHMSHQFVIGALTTLIASTMSYTKKDEINYDSLKQVSRLLKNLLLSPEAEVSKGNLIQKLVYGRKWHLIKAMSKSKMCDVLFSLASSVNDRQIFRSANHEVSSIFEDIFCIIASIFEAVDPSQIFTRAKLDSANNLEDRNLAKKPIRHGRFSGSVSVQLSTGENIVINNTKLFAAGIPGHLDMILRRNNKLEVKMYAQAETRKDHSAEERELFLKLSVEFLESHLNAVYSAITEGKTAFEFSNQHRKYLILISKYFMEFCHRAYSISNGKLDYYKLIYGMLNVKYILNDIDYLHDLISSKNYPVILKLLPYFKELLTLVQMFSNSDNDQRQSVSKNLQKQLLHSKNVLLLVRRVIMVAKPVMKHFIHICIECNDILFKLTKKYSLSHEYWHVSSLTCSEIFSRENDSENYDNFNTGQESNFNFESLIKHYSSREVIDFYGFALMNCQFEARDFNSMIARFLHFVVKSEHFFKSLMRPSIIVKLQIVATAPESWIKQNQDLVITSNKIVRKFSSLIISDPTNLVLSFFN